MDWFPLWNSLRIAAISSVLVFFTGIAAAYYAVRLPRMIKGVLDVVLTLPLVLPPTVVGYFLLLLFGTRRPLGMALESIGVKLVMTWYGGVVAAAVVAFPLLYRTARGAFEAFDETLAQAGQTLGLSNTYIFWRIRMPACRQGIFAGIVLAFARALGEYGATSMLIGYTPGRTATISTTVYQLWRTATTCTPSTGCWSILRSRRQCCSRSTCLREISARGCAAYEPVRGDPQTAGRFCAGRPV